MSGEPFQCGYGAIVDEDVIVLETCLRELLLPVAVEKLRVVEIGMHDGGTARGIEQFVREHGADLEYWGIDPDEGKTRPRYLPKGGVTVIGDSAEVFHHVPDGVDLVWVDGCHCVNHVILDTVHYAPKVRVGGFMLFHDVAPAGQMHPTQGRQYHGPMIPEFNLAVGRAHELIRWPFDGWAMILEAWPTDRNDCGTRAFRRLR
jgi:hypothetical protein